MPNDLYITGGTHEFDVDDEHGDGLGEETPSVVICTGANACGKVCDAFSPSAVPLLKPSAERLPEAGKSTAVSNHSIYQRRLSQTALIQYMAQVIACSSCLVFADRVPQIGW